MEGAPGGCKVARFFHGGGRGRSGLSGEKRQPYSVFFLIGTIGRACPRPLGENSNRSGGPLEHTAVLRDLAVVLAIATVVALVFSRLRLSVVAAFLVAGAILEIG